MGSRLAVWRAKVGVDSGSHLTRRVVGYGPSRISQR